MDAEVLLSADTPIAELGRRMMAAQLAIIQAHARALQQTADPQAVHETRKAIRRTYTAVRLFRPYFEPGLLDRYRRRLKKLMRRLAPCRDTAVFLGKLQAYMADSGAALDSLVAHWQQQSAADLRLRRYLERPKWPAFWEKYAAFTQTTGQGALPLATTSAQKARYLIPVLLYQRVAGVRAYEDDSRSHPTQADIVHLHELRIQCKELRYAFEFFAPLLGSEITPVIAVLEQLQDNLGDLNDARVALALLAQTAGQETAVAHYRAVQQAEIGRLLAEFQPLWAELTSLEWRRNLALAVAIL